MERELEAVGANGRERDGESDSSENRVERDRGLKHYDFFFFFN